MAVVGAPQACWLGFDWGEAAPFACVDRSVMERSPFACVSCRCLVWEEDMKESLTYSAVGFSRSLEASFIGSNADPDERYAPRILSNSESSGNVLSVLKSELRTCTSFDFSVCLHHGRRYSGSDQDPCRFASSWHSLSHPYLNLSEFQRAR